jgi:DNA replication licensing factor MCM4
VQGDIVIDTQDPFNLNNILRQGLQSREDELMKLGRSADIYERLTASLAPSIWQMDDVKKGILCQLFGAGTKVCSFHTN